MGKTGHKHLMMKTKLFENVKKYRKHSWICSFGVYILVHILEKLSDKCSRVKSSHARYEEM